MSLTKYLFIKENGRKFLLLKLLNNRDEKVTGVTVEVCQKDARGTNLGTLIVDCPVTGGNPRSSFVLGRRIALADDCVDFSVKILSASFGNYTYTDDGKGLSLSYNKQTDSKTPVGALPVRAAGGDNPSVKTRKVTISVAACVFMFVVLAASALFTYLHLQKFMADSDTFFYLGVEYSFEDNDKSENSNIYVVGSKSSAKNIVIPEKIKSHEVTGISKNAFYANSVIESVTITGAMEIEYSTFFRCRNLAVINMEKVTRIGSAAFADCTSLKELNAFNLNNIGTSAFENCSSLTTVNISGSDSDSILTIGSNAFGSCPSLKVVDIDQFTYYPELPSIFSNSLNISSLRLKNFNYSGIYSDYYPGSNSETIHGLFEISDSSARQLKQFEKLVIDYCDKITDYFCNNIPLSYITIKNLESAEVGESAFNNCTNLKSLDVPLTFTKVGDNAFYKTAIPAFDGSSLSYIGDNAFWGCSKLSVFAIADNEDLSHIGARAFSGCTALLEAPLSQVVSVGEEAFKNCSSLTSLNFPQSLISIGAYAFAGCTKLESVSVPQNVKNIGLGSFFNCTKLREITLPFIGGSSTENTFLAYIFGTDSPETFYGGQPALEKVTVKSAPVISEYAFYNFRYLKEIVIEGEISVIGALAFKQCNNLNNFIIPASVTQIGIDAFAECYKLYEVYNLSSLNITCESYGYGMAGYYALTVYKSLDQEKIPKVSYDGYEFGRSEHGEWYLTSYKGTKTSLLLPQDVYYDNTRIGSYRVIKYMMQDNSTVRDITIPDAVTAIREYAFSNCMRLSSVTMTKSVESVGIGAFSGCSSLKNAVLPFIGNTLHDNRFLNYIFGSAGYDDLGKVPVSLLTVTILNAADVPDNAFNGCRYLAKVNLPDNCTSIGEYAFKDCQNINSVTVPDSVSSIGKGAFSGCSSISDITLPFIGGTTGNNRYLSYIFGSESYFNNSVPASLNTVTITLATDVPDYAFYKISSLTAINLPDTVSAIGSYAFYDLYNLTSIKLPDAVKTIGSYAFDTNQRLTSITLPGAIETIGSYAFQYCIELATVTFPEGLISIGASAFQACYKLKEIKLPSTLQEIGANAFNMCNVLEKVTVTSDVVIQHNAFYQCHRLLEVYNLGGMDISAGSKNNGYIAYYALAVYTSLQDTPLEQVTINGIVFKYYKDSWAVVDYAGYASELKLSAFMHNGKTISSYIIKYNAFSGKTSLVNIIIGKEVTFIEQGAFNNCTNLKTVRFENSAITELSNLVFSNCHSLISIDLPQNLVSIGDNAFIHCYKLTSIRIPESITAIGNNAFYNCFSLYDLFNFSKTLTIISGQQNNGYAAYYALRVSTSEDAVPFETVDVDNCRFLLFEGHWYMINASNDYALSLPKSFVYKQTTISSYIVMESAFAGKYGGNIFIPDSVSKIQKPSFSGYYFDLDAIFYEGTEEQWVELIKDFSGSQLLNGTTVSFNSQGNNRR